MSILFVSTVYGKISIKERDWKIFRKTGFEYKLYFILKDYMSFDQAEGYCRNKNAHLVSIHSDEENQFVNQLLKRGWAKVWIGLGRVGENMVWTDGSPFDFANWAWGQPYYRNSYSNNHIYMVIGPEVSGNWYVFTGHSEQQMQLFVCKRKAQSHIS
ncbi:hypothetical protein Y032_0410g943 [Ancylostoma ceylanicum]|nr:hypothetical protein Y032_0410g943 [Ancylostoma ceylanicum]